MSEAVKKCCYEAFDSYFEDDTIVIVNCSRNDVLKFENGCKVPHIDKKDFSHYAWVNCPKCSECYFIFRKTDENGRWIPS